MDEENWKPINGYPNYEISNHGNVRLTADKKLLSPYIAGKQGLRQVKLSSAVGSIRRARTVHVLVAEHFLPGYEPGYVIEHKDRDLQNNHWSNLKIDWYRRSTAR